MEDKEDVLSIISSIKTVGETADDVCRYDDPTLVQVLSMPYRDLRVCIFKKTSEDVDLFYYEPIVSLDPKSITIKRASSHRFQVSFDVELWNSFLESQITVYLQKNGRFEPNRKFNLQVMPYEEIHLVELGSESEKEQLELPSRPKSFLKLNKSLRFGVFCSSKETAEMVSNPDYLEEHLALVFKSPACGSNDGAFHHGAAFGVKRSNRFELNLVRETDVEKGHDSNEKGSQFLCASKCNKSAMMLNLICFFI